MLDGGQSATLEPREPTIAKGRESDSRNIFFVAVGLSIQMLAGRATSVSSVSSLVSPSPPLRYCSITCPLNISDRRS